MFNLLFKKIFGSRNDRVLRRLQVTVDRINQLEPSFQALSDDQLKAKTEAFRSRLKEGETLVDILPEAFATVREASLRTLKLRHFDVQLIGGIVLHEGKIAEMRTGEGKTLVATLPAYLNALSGYSVHIITVNDYLARRDCEWMKPIYDFLGLTVGVITTDMLGADKKAAYTADIVYGTNNEFGFDYLRDNMAFSVEDKVQRHLNYAIIDEVDSILIDEARTPLIISGALEDSSDLYLKINQIVPKLIRQLTASNEGDYTVDEKTRQVHLTEEGHQHLEELLVRNHLLKPGDSLYSPLNISLMHHVNAALRAHNLFHVDVDYIVKENQIIIVDEHTGRTMPGRRWSEGLHQAIEAKEEVAIQQENQTLASITFQNYFRLYGKIAGMTGTADTEAYEFHQIYRLEVVVIPTNKPMVREDQSDLIFLKKADKLAAIIEDIKDCLQRGQPVLVGTTSIENSEQLSRLLQQEKIAHQVLNAKFHEREAAIIAEAGRPGVVTLATNMAGRGTDIVLGGNLQAELPAITENTARETLRIDWQTRHQQVLNAGGLRIIGSERHESRRIDNQLRGRAGRQGDPGSSRFYLSLEDDLMRIFASERVASMMQKLGMQPGEAISHPWVNKAIENAQRKVEGRNFDIRKQLLEYDNVVNDQRKVIYQQRDELLQEQDLSHYLQDMRLNVFNHLIDTYIPSESMEEQWNIDGLIQHLQNEFGLYFPIQAWLANDKSLNEFELKEKLQAAIAEHFAAKEALIGADNLRQIEKSVMLQLLDNQWREHLAALDHLRQGIHLRGYAQKDPKQEYKREAFNLFSNMITTFQYQVIVLLSTIELQTDSDIERLEEQRRADATRTMSFQHPAVNEPEPRETASIPDQTVPFVRPTSKVGRNEPCPCGSNRKFKQCHGRLMT